MRIFIYNVNNKNEFLSEKEVDELTGLDGCSTVIEYPPTEIGFVRCFISESNIWSDPVEDHRGSVIYKKSNSLSNKKFWDIGSIPDGYTLIAPPNDGFFIWDESINGWKEPVIIEDPIKYSKLSIYRKLKELGKWSEIKEIMIDAEAYDEWEFCTYLQSDDLLFNQLVFILKEKYPELDIDNLLMDCIY